MTIMVFETESRYDGAKANVNDVTYRFGGTFLDFVFDQMEDERGLLEEPFELVDAGIDNTNNHAFAIWKWRGKEDRIRTVDIVAVC